MYKSKLWLEKQYIQERLSVKTIASMAGCSERTIFMYITKFGLRR